MLREFSDYFFEHLESGNAPGVLPITSACNAQCLFCSNHTNPFEVHRTRHRPVEEIEKVIWAMNPNYPGEFLLNEAITGKLSEGEVFTHPKVFDILSVIRAKYPKNILTIATNGSLCTEEKIVRLADFKPVKMPISIHSFDREYWKYIFKLKDKHYDTAMKSIPLLMKHGIKVGLRMIAMPALVGYDDLERSVRASKKLGFDFLGMTHASWTRYTKPEVVKELYVNPVEMAAFAEAMSKKYQMTVNYTERPDKPLEYDFDKIDQLTEKYKDQKRIFWLTSSSAYDRIKPKILEAGEKHYVENVVLKVENEAFGGNISCAGLWMISDIDSVIKKNNLKDEQLIVRGRFLNKYGYDLMGQNIVDYLKTSENRIEFV